MSTLTPVRHRYLGVAAAVAALALGVAACGSSDDSSSSGAASS